MPDKDTNNNQNSANNNNSNGGGDQDKGYKPNNEGYNPSTTDEGGKNPSSPDGGSGKTD